MLLDIVIVNWNSGDQLRTCLRSLVAAADGTGIGQVVIVDNASRDGSVDDLEFDLPIVVIRNSENRGFAAACNQGASICRSEYLLFLNPDTEVPADALDAPLKFMESPENERVGVCGIPLVNSTGVVSRSCARFPSAGLLVGVGCGLTRVLPRIFHDIHLIEWDHKETRDVDHVIGAFYLIRRRLFVALNGFDERYFVYLEDLDLSKSVIDAGYRIVYLTCARAFHREGGTSEQIKARRLFYSRRSRIQYAFKHFSRESALCVLIVTLLVEPVAMAFRGVLRGSPLEMWQTSGGFALLWRDLPSILQKAFETRTVVISDCQSSSQDSGMTPHGREAA